MPHIWQECAYHQNGPARGTHFTVLQVLINPKDNLEGICHKLVCKFHLYCTCWVYNRVSDWLQTLLAACQGREIQLKMLITRGESVQRNTSAEGVPVVRKQIQDLKDSWESLLSTSIQCKRSENSLSLSLSLFILSLLVLLSQHFLTYVLIRCLCGINRCLVHVLHLQPAGRCLVTLDKLPGRCQSVWVLDGASRRELRKHRQTLRWNEGQDSQSRPCQSN